MPYADKEKQKEYQRKWMLKRRSDFFNDKCCLICGSKENLELDHVDPAIKTTHRIWSWSEKRRQEEISKCQVLCSSCHKQKTAKFISETRTIPLVHGTYSGYGKGCRCVSCCEALRAHWRLRRSKDNKS